MLSECDMREPIEYEKLPEGWKWRRANGTMDCYTVICPNGHEAISTSAELRDGTRILVKVECLECGLSEKIKTWEDKEIVMLTKLDEEDSEGLKEALKELQREDLIEFIVITQQLNGEKHAIISGDSEHLYDWIKRDIEFNKEINSGKNGDKCLKKHYII